MDGLPIIILLLVIIVMFGFLRGGGRVGRGNQPKVVQALLFDVKLNQVLVETFHMREKPRRFERANWEVNKDNLDFLDETFVKKCGDCDHEHENTVEKCEKCGSANLREPFQLGNTLSHMFETVGEFNDQIKAAKKAKSTSSLNIDVDKLKEPLAQSRQGLEDWMMCTIGQKELPPPEPPTLTSMLFGQR